MQQEQILISMGTKGQKLTFHGIRKQIQYLEILGNKETNVYIYIVEKISRAKAKPSQAFWGT